MIALNIRSYVRCMRTLMNSILFVTKEAYGSSDGKRIPLLMDASNTRSTASALLPLPLTLLTCSGYLLTTGTKR